MTTVAILQSCYIPWKGYFDIIHDVDLFIFYDDVQYTKNDWRNRNRIKTANGVTWLSIPAGSSTDRLICEVSLSDHRWQTQHWKSLAQTYGKAPHFRDYAGFFEEAYLGRAWTSLSDLNQFLTRKIAEDFLGIATRFEDSRRYAAQGVKQERLLDIIRKAGATRYVSGPAAKNYIDPARFDAAGIELIWKNYAGYPEYPQLHPPFEHAVTVLDLLFHTGPRAAWYIWGWRGAAVGTENSR
jgi:hypothetical protein